MNYDDNKEKAGHIEPKAADNTSDPVGASDISSAGEGEIETKDNYDESLTSSYESVGGILRQIIPILVITTIGSILAGLVFVGMSEQLELLPGLIVLIPAVMDTRGNIYAALGSRLSTGLHLGIILPAVKRNPSLINISSISLVNSAIVSIVIAIFAYAVLFALGIDSIPLWALVVISLIAGVISGVILLFVVILFAFFGYRKGIDPDNLLPPVVTITGDVFSILALLLAASIVLGVL